MNVLRNTVLALMIGCASAASAQQAPTTPRPEAKQFDFLIGQWELEVHPKTDSLMAKIHGAPQLTGIWKAWRAFDGFGVDDEIRIIDKSGNPVGFSHAMRAYSSAESGWLVVSLDVYRGRLTESKGQLQDADIVLNGKGTDPEGKPVLTRARYSKITADSFHLQNDRSADNGATWDEAVLVIDAKRVGAAATR
jgi:hypothetical protein